MSETIVFGGAQIPVSPEIDTNMITLKRAIDWAAENNVDYLVTPEGSLSGYVPWFNEEVPEEKIVNAVWEIVDYAASQNVGLALGTKYKDNGNVYNQMRVYNQEGIFQGTHNKMYTLSGWDKSVLPDIVKPIDIMHKGRKLKVLCLLCNDFWGGYNQNINVLPKMINYKDTYAHIILHGSNAMRGEGLLQEDVLYEWHNSVLRMISYETQAHVVSVDNCIKMNGQFYDGRTSSRSGIVYNGQWLTEEKTSGEQYFKIELDLDKLVNGEYKINLDEKTVVEKALQGHFQQV